MPFLQHHRGVLFPDHAEAGQPLSGSSSGDIITKGVITLLHFAQLQNTKEKLIDKDVRDSCLHLFIQQLFFKDLLFSILYSEQ